MREQEPLTSFSHEFRNPEMERWFRQAERPEKVRQLRISMLVAAVAFLILIAVDYSLLGLSARFYLLTLLRVVVALACLVLLTALGRSPALADTPLPLNLVCFILVTCVLLVAPLRPETAGSQLTAVVVVSFALYLFIPNRIHWMLALNAYLAVGFLLAVMLFSNLSMSRVFGTAIVLVLLNTIGLVIARRLAALQRRQFASLTAEREINQLLQQEIDERKGLEDRLRHLAQRDDLTGLNNRRWFLELAGQELRRSRRRNSPLSLCMVDLDHFKSINDRFGHAAGDKVLVQAANVCQEALRESDILGRFGGEEFVIALPDTDARGAREVAERLRERLYRFRFTDTAPDLRMTATAGIAEVRPQDDGLEPALHRADKAMYTGKDQGRNRVIVDDSPGQSTPQAS